MLLNDKVHKEYYLDINDKILNIIKGWMKESS